MIITRITGWIFVIGGVPVLLFDVALSVTLDQRTPAALRQLRPDFNSGSFEIAHFMRDTVFGFWSAVALLAVGFLLLIMFSRPVDRA